MKTAYNHTLTPMDKIKTSSTRIPMDDTFYYVILQQTDTLHIITVYDRHLIPLGEAMLDDLANKTHILTVKDSTLELINEEDFWSIDLNTIIMLVLYG